MRNPVYRWLLARLPLTKRQQIAREWREKSRAANSNKAENIMDVSPRTVSDVMEKYGVNRLLHGHTHRPAVQDIDLDGTPARRIVLGDWHAVGSVLRCDTGA